MALPHSVVCMYVQYNVFPNCRCISLVSEVESSKLEWERKVLSSSSVGNCETWDLMRNIRFVFAAAVGLYFDRSQISWQEIRANAESAAWLMSRALNPEKRESYLILSVFYLRSVSIWAIHATLPPSYIYIYMVQGNIHTWPWHAMASFPLLIKALMANAYKRTRLASIVASYNISIYLWMYCIEKRRKVSFPFLPCLRQSSSTSSSLFLPHCLFSLHYWKRDVFFRTILTPKDKGMNERMY